MAYSKNQIEQLWVDEGGDPKAAPTAAAIALAESGGNASATNHNTNGTVDKGLFQINSIHGARSTYDLAGNVRAAIAISNNGRNWTPWVTYNTGAYKKFTGGRTSSSNPARVSSMGSGGHSSVRTRTIPGVDNSAQRAQVQSQQQQSMLDFLGGRADSLDFALQQKGFRDQLAGLQDVPAKTIQMGVQSPASGGTSGSLADVAMHRANVIDAQQLPYEWGGGHQGQTPLHQAVPLDCSGAVSKVLGIDPRVSGQFQSWGRPGDGGNKGVTIYANGKHVLMKIDGHFFGTSSTNPGGGAGWIKAGDISPDYLKNFTVRHSNR